MKSMIELSRSLANEVSLTRTRYLYNEIDWNARLIEITGSRGVGTTTLMLQRLAEMNKEKKGSALYFSLDHPHFFSASIHETADEFSRMGGKYLFLDEVHKYPPKHKSEDWSAGLKSVYDEYPDLHIVYSGSSLLKIYPGRGDLSRIKSSYRMKGFSFREYLQIEDILDTGPYHLSQVLEEHASISRGIADRIKVFPHFLKYLEQGYYPFYKESKTKYAGRLADLLNCVLETGIPSVAGISFESIFRIKKLLAAVAASSPSSPNLSYLRSELSIPDQRTLLSYLNLLEKSGIISTLSENGSGNTILNKPDKIYPDNTNLLKILAPGNTDPATVRETFFLNQTGAGHDLTYPEKGHFLVDKRYLFEVTGQDEDRSRIGNESNVFLAVDELETGTGNQIPLWLFGFLY